MGTGSRHFNHKRDGDNLMPVYDPNNPLLIPGSQFPGSNGLPSNYINRTTFAGMTIAQVQVAFTQLQAGYIALVQGGKPVTVSYEGKSVTYTPADAVAMKNLMDEAARILGFGRQRRALTPVFR